MAMLFMFYTFDVFGFSVRIALRHKPVLRDRLFYGVLAGAFAHGTYLVYPLSHPLNYCLFLPAPPPPQNFV